MVAVLGVKQGTCTTLPYNFKVMLQEEEYI